jgi:hypothetical protein
MASPLAAFVARASAAALASLASLAYGCTVIKAFITFGVFRVWYGWGRVIVGAALAAALAALT